MENQIKSWRWEVSLQKSSRSCEVTRVYLDGIAIGDWISILWVIISTDKENGAGSQTWFVICKTESEVDQ